MKESEILSWINSLSENERMILASFESERVLPENIEKFWNQKALKKLIFQGLIEWTMKGYELSEDGFSLAQIMHKQDKSAEVEVGAKVDNADRLADFVKCLPGFVLVEKIDGLYGHMGATLCDSVLQAGINYRNTVEPRISRLIEKYPDAKDTSAFAALIEKEGLGNIIQWKEETRKPKTIKDLVNLFKAHHVENEAQLSKWLTEAANLKLLKEIKGVGPKTVDYLCILVGLQKVAIDRHLNNFLTMAGITFKGYEEANEIIQKSAAYLNIKPEILDHSIWRYMSEKQNMGKPKT